MKDHVSVFLPALEGKAGCPFRNVAYGRWQDEPYLVTVEEAQRWREQWPGRDHYATMTLEQAQLIQQLGRL